MSFLVVDASVVFGWCFSDAATELSRLTAETLKSDPGIVPAIFPFEVANVLSIAERHGRIDANGADRFAALVDALGLSVDRQGMHRANHEIRRLANAESLSVYDAAYLELAIRTQAALSNQDSQLHAACKRRGVRTLGA